VPVVTYMAVSPVEYFRCRYERGQIGWGRAQGIELVIRVLMTINGWLATRAVALGAYLETVAQPYCSRLDRGFYYGVDTSLFRPANVAEWSTLRHRHGLPTRDFLVLFASRMSHEKDPETLLRAIGVLRASGIDATVLNLGGNHAEFLDVAARLGVRAWAMARPAVHPMGELADYVRAAD